MPLATQVVSGNPTAHPCDVLAVLVRESAIDGGKIADAALGDADRALHGLVGRAAAEEEFKGRDGQTLSLHTHGKLAAARLLAVGLGKSKDFDRDLEALRQAASRALRAARAAGAKTLALSWPRASLAPALALEVQALAEGAGLGAYRFDRYLREKKPLKVGRVELIVQGSGKPARALAEAASLGARVAQTTGLARDLVNEPAGRMTPRALADAARAVAREHGLSIEVRGRSAIEKLGMKLFLGVAQGSVEEPQLVHLTYAPKGQRPRAASATAARAAKGARKDGAAREARTSPLALVGKAITFDSGGLSIKTAQGMEDMKTDMAGAAAVIAAMALVAEIAPPFPVHGFFGACENMPSGTAYKPGDVIVGKNGTSVEILNTDAEGRLVLADVLAWAAEHKPSAIIDLATLTGAILVALGPWISGLFSNDDALAAELLAAASSAGEAVWRMPLPPEMEELIKSPVADLKNTGGRFGGSINAALFLQHFVGKVPWAHLDIAGPSSIDKEKGYNPRGGTGAGVRLLAEFVRRRAAE
ncbi:MAG TPA: leucyl aminopeptidase [Myxococcales bacterium]|nr:leucyl aminopeptidase [Myxococcales bacterium]